MVQEAKIFMNRRDAGFELGKLLDDKYKNKNALFPKWKYKKMQLIT